MNYIGVQNGSLVNYIGVVNTSMKNYVDSQDIIFNDSVNNYIVDVNATQSSWVDNLFVRFTEIVDQVGNWTLDKVNYYTSSEVDDINTSMKNYVNVQNGSMVNYIGVVNTTRNNYVTDVFVPYTGGTKNVDLGAHNLSVDTSVLFVDSNNDRVGIGTTEPSNKLEVNGTINATTIMVGTTDVGTWLYNQTIPANTYTDIQNGSLVNYIGVQNGSLVNYIGTVNTSMGNYVVDYVGIQNGSMVNYIGVVNTSVNNWISDNNASVNNYIVDYVGIQNGSLVNYIAVVNTSMKNYVNVQNGSMVNYIGTVNTSMGNYVDAQDVVYNDSMKAYVDVTFVELAGDTMTGALDMGNNAITNIDWANSDDGSGSGLDADLLDAYDSGFFMPLNTSLYGDFDFNGGWTGGGLSIIDGDIYAQTGWFYNITGLDVSTLKINGSLLPQTGFDNQFDIGSSSLRWKDLYLGGDANITGTLYVAGVNISANNDSMKNYVDTQDIVFNTTMVNYVGTVNTSMKNYVGVQNGSMVNYIGVVNTSMSNYIVDYVGIQNTSLVNYIGTVNTSMGNYVDAQNTSQTNLINLNNASVNNYIVDYVGIQNTSLVNYIGVQNTSLVNYIGVVNTTRNNYVTDVFVPYTGASKNLNLGDNNLSVNTSVFFVDTNNDRVGIGTTSPSYKFEVNGGVFATRNSDGFQLHDSSNNQILAGDATSTIFNGNKADMDFILHADTVDNAFFMQGSSGNVGIGTTSPDNMLHVDDDSASHLGTVRIGGGDTDFGIELNYTQVGTTTGTIYSSPGYSNANVLLKIGAGSGNADQLVLKGDGNVGIGTTSPTYALEVAGSAHKIALTDSGDSENIRVEISDSSGNGGFISLYDDSESETAKIRSYASGGVQAYFTAGNVGIGTTSPAQKLDVDGWINSKAGLMTRQTNNVSVIGGYIGSGGNINAPPAFYDTFLIQSVSNLTFGVGSGWAPKMFIDSSGNVGIGTASPAQKLDVDGWINSKTGLMTRQTNNVSVIGGYIGSGGNINAPPAFYDTFLIQSVSNLTFGVGSGWAPKMFIDSSGNVGIGTTSPGVVNGYDITEQRVAHIFSSGENSRMSVEGEHGAALDLVDRGGTANQKWAILNVGEEKVYLQAINDAGATTYNLLTGDLSSGNVGIGTTGPNSLLEVDGTFNATSNQGSLIVDANGNIKIGI